MPALITKEFLWGDLVEIVRYASDTDDLVFIWSTPWKDEGKYQYSSVYFKEVSTGVLYVYEVQRNGSYFSEYHYNNDNTRETDTVAARRVEREDYLITRMSHDKALLKDVLRAIYDKDFTKAQELSEQFIKIHRLSEET